MRLTVADRTHIDTINRNCAKAALTRALPKEPRTLKLPFASRHELLHFLVCAALAFGGGFAATAVLAFHGG